MPPMIMEHPETFPPLVERASPGTGAKRARNLEPDLTDEVFEAITAAENAPVARAPGEVRARVGCDMPGREGLMDCMICNGRMAYYFSKTFAEYDLGTVSYWRCPSCGFVASKTHLELSDSAWELLNERFHAANNAREDNPHQRNQRYFHQSLMLHLMARHGLLSGERWLDWGSGPGRVSIQLDRHFGRRLENFDAYVEPLCFRTEPDEMQKRSYDLVLNTAVFEHVRGRSTLDEIESYVGPRGELAVHTLVRGEIPADPSWMYLLPVHCAFHTNHSMSVLLDQWGFRCSVYCLDAKTWVFFRRPAEEIAPGVAAVNQLLGWNWLHFKAGFMDYWP